MSYAVPSATPLYPPRDQISPLFKQMTMNSSHHLLYLSVNFPSAGVTDRGSSSK